MEQSVRIEGALQIRNELGKFNAAVLQRLLEEFRPEDTEKARSNHVDEASLASSNSGKTGRINRLVDILGPVVSYGEWSRVEAVAASAGYCHSWTALIAETPLGIQCGRAESFAQRLSGILGAWMPHSVRAIDYAGAVWVATILFDPFATPRAPRGAGKRPWTQWVRVAPGEPVVLMSPRPREDHFVGCVAAALGVPSLGDFNLAGQDPQSLVAAAARRSGEAVRVVRAVAATPMDFAAARSQREWSSVAKEGVHPSGTTSKGASSLSAQNRVQISESSLKKRRVQAASHLFADESEHPLECTSAVQKVTLQCSSKSIQLTLEGEDVLQSFRELVDFGLLVPPLPAPYESLLKDSLSVVNFP